MQHLFRPNPRIARNFALYDEHLKLHCLENSIKFSNQSNHNKEKSAELAHIWQMVSVCLGDLNT